MMMMMMMMMMIMKISKTVLQAELIPSDFSTVHWGVEVLLHKHF